MSFFSGEFPQSVTGATHVVKQLNLRQSAIDITKTRLTNLPRLVSDRALENAFQDLASQTESELITGFVPSVEFVPMAKRGHGNRPLAILSPQTRVALEALTAALEDSLPPSSRAMDFHDFESFGSDISNAWVVEFDIAACYEFIDHTVLRHELILQGADAETVDLVCRTLSTLFGRQIGLPQEVAASHRLSDSYLDMIVRGVSRHGYQVGRYADDFRVLATSMKEAFQVIEIAMEEARKAHLALAEQKIRIRPTEKIAQEITERSILAERYQDEVFGELARPVIVSRRYDDYEVDFIEPDPSEVDFNAITRILADWADLTKEHGSPMAYAGTIALSEAGRFSDNIPNATLAALVAKEPIRLQKVMAYLETRDAGPLSWELLNLIANQERSTPWHKIWLLSTASKLSNTACTAREAFLAYARNQLEDTYEVVRLEAAWLLALNSQIQSTEVQRLYAKASRVSQIGLAAVAGQVDKGTNQTVNTSIKGDSRLNKRAYEWGEAYSATP